MGDLDLDLTQLRSAARAYLEWEAEVSGFGVPAVQVQQERAWASSAAVAGAADKVPAASANSFTSPSTFTSTSTFTSPSMSTPPDAEAGSFPGREAAAGAAAIGGATATLLSSEQRRVRLGQIDEEVRACARCELARGRTHTVFARGNPDSHVVFVGEGPGQEEDRVGQPFVGAAGQLLDKMVGAMGFSRDDVYICNVVKCRPPGNRTPLPVEAQACSSYLHGQLEAVQPRVIVALGRCAAENMGLVAGGGWRGRWGKFRGFDVMPTYHPAFLLRSPEFKRPVWEDLQQVMSKLKQPG